MERDSLKLWDPATGREIRSFKWPTDGVQALAFSPDGSHLVSAGAARFKNQLKLWEVASERETMIFEGHNFPVQSVAFSPRSSLLASSSVATDKSLKGEVRLWDWKSGRQLLLIKVSTGAIGSLASARTAAPGRRVG